MASSGHRYNKQNRSLFPRSGRQKFVNLLSIADVPLREDRSIRKESAGPMERERAAERVHEKIGEGTWGVRQERGAEQARREEVGAGERVHGE